MSNYYEEGTNITTIIYDKNLKELLRIARNRLNPKDLQVEPYIKEIDKEYFILLQTKLIRLKKH